MSAEIFRHAKALLHAGRAEDAWASLQSINDADPVAAHLWYYRSVAALSSGRLDDADASARRAHAANPTQPYFCLQAARVFDARDNLDDAIELYRQASALQPTLALAWLGLGRCLVLSGCAEEARAALDMAAANGAGAAALLELARLNVTDGRLDEALLLAKQAATDPARRPDALLLMGDIHHRRQEFVQALDHYGLADFERPGDPSATLAAAAVLRAQGLWEKAMLVSADLALRRPECLAVALSAKLSLPSVYAGVRDLAQARQRYEHGLEALATVPPDTFAMQAPALMQELSWTNFLLAYQGHDDVALQSKFGDFVNRLLRTSAPDWLRLPAQEADLRRKIRVGFVSDFFRDCTVGRYFASWVAGLDASRFNVFVYYTNARESPSTGHIRRCVTAFRHVRGASIHAIARQIRNDALDILVYPEVGMHADTQVLASLRLAPRQCAAWGHPTTTGLPTIDWFISCDSMEPAGAQAHYRERLVLLPGLGTAYPRPEEPAPASRAELGLPEGKTLYLIPQSAFKIHPDNDELIASVLAADRNGVGVLFAADAAHIIDILVRRMKPVFERHGLSVSHNLVFLPSVAHDVFLAVNRHCDVMLDTLHWSGGNTALDALSVGLPIVTLPGALMRGRQSSAMLRILGVEELIVSDTEAYVRTAVRLGTDAAWRQSLRARILEGLPKLFDDPAPIAALNDLLLQLAREPIAAPPNTDGKDGQGRGSL